MSSDEITAQDREAAEAEAARFARRRNAPLILRTAMAPIRVETSTYPFVRREGVFGQARRWAADQADPRARMIELGMRPDDADLLIEVM